jgi:hypothetical protein
MTEAMVTDGTIAIRNLEAQIEGLQPEAALCRAPVDERVRLARHGARVVALRRAGNRRVRSDRRR